MLLKRWTRNTERDLPNPNNHIYSESNLKRITFLSENAAILAVSGRTRTESMSGQEVSTLFA
jgi:hypothetical protein